MANPIVRIDLSDHPLYSGSDEHYGWLGREWDAEILMVNTNTGSMRVRLYDTVHGELAKSNFDISMSNIVEDSFTIKVR